MALKDDVEKILNHIKSEDEKKRVQHNGELFEIYEGDLVKFLLKDLKNQLSAKAFNRIQGRLAPINVLPKYVDKLSKIYQQSPMRMPTTEAESDKEFVERYSKFMNIDVRMNNANEFYNMFKNTLIEPYVHKGVPKIRSIRSDLFYVLSMDEVDPNEPTHIAVTMGKDKGHGGRTLYRAYTDEEFLIFDSEGKIRTDLMMKFGNPEGENPIGNLPFIYANQSQNLLTPRIDTDTLKMIKIIPILLSDLNYSVWFQAFSLLFMINVDESKFERNPDSVLFLKSAEGTEGNPEVGTIKPEVDIDKVLELIQAQFSFWLNTKGIRPGSVGKLTESNFASGISKIIDDMDTFEARQKQVTAFQQTELELWRLLSANFHPYWKEKGLLSVDVPDPSKEMFVQTSFPVQLPMVNRGEAVKDLEAEVDAGFTSRMRAIKALNPRMTDAEIEDLMKEIDDEKGFSLEGIGGETGV